MRPRTCCQVYVVRAYGGPKRIGWSGAMNTKAVLFFCTLCFFCAHTHRIVFGAASGQTLTVVAQENHIPFSYTDPSGKPAGMLIDLWKLWTQRTGIPVRFVLSETSDAESQVLDGRADVWIGVFPPAPRTDVLLSEPFVIVSRDPSATAHDNGFAIRAAVHPDRTDLLEGINQGLRQLREEDRHSVLLHWWPQGDWVYLPRSRIKTVTMLGASFLGLWTVGVYMLYRYRLKERAQEHLRVLAELRRKNNALQSEIAERRNVEKDKERLIQELREALENVRKLRGLLPICAYCKKIRDDQGYWNQLESYITQHADVTFTHSVCPECSKRIYAELRAFKEGEQQKKKAASE